LRGLALFGALSQEAVEYLAARLSIAQVPAGEWVFREGDAGSALYVILEGEMEVLKENEHGGRTLIAMLGPGDWIGEMSIVDIQPRSASVRATARSRLLAVSAADLDALYRADLKAYCMLVLNLARELSRRLRVADTLLAQIATSVIHRELR
jgi:CRP/FNR family cyclic AMP-dependent transcriptional regulator